MATPMSYLRDTLAASATFRTWTGSADAAAAKLKIYYSSHASGTYPCAVINLENSNTEQIATATSKETGELLLEFYDDIGTSDDGTALDDLDQKVRAIKSEMMAVAHTAGMLCIESMDVGFPFRTSPEEESTDDDVYYAPCRVKYWGAS